MRSPQVRKIAYLLGCSDPDFILCCDMNMATFIWVFWGWQLYDNACLISVQMQGQPSHKREIRMWGSHLGTLKDGPKDWHIWPRGLQQPWINSIHYGASNATTNPQHPCIPVFTFWYARLK